MYLGKEAMNANGVEVFAMPRLKKFLETNGPWSQLVNLNNIHLNILKADSKIVLSTFLSASTYSSRSSSSPHAILESGFNIE